MPISSVFTCVPALVCVLSDCVYFLHYVNVTSSYFRRFFLDIYLFIIVMSAVRVAIDLLCSRYLSGMAWRN